MGKDPEMIGRQMGDLYVCGDVSGYLSGHQYKPPLSDYDMALLEAPEGGEAEAWVIDYFHGCHMSLEGLAAYHEVPMEELRDQLPRAIVDEGTGDGDTGGGDAGDILGELDTDPGQNGVRKTIRNLDQGAIDFIRGVTGASSDAEVVRKAVALAEHMLVQD